MVKKSGFMGLPLTFIGGVIGFVAINIAMICILGAVLLYTCSPLKPYPINLFGYRTWIPGPNVGYSWTTQWISDLGVGPSSYMFNVGLMVTGVLCIPFFPTLLEPLEYTGGRGGPNSRRGSHRNRSFPREHGCLARSLLSNLLVAHRHNSRNPEQRHESVHVLLQASPVDRVLRACGGPRVPGSQRRLRLRSRVDNALHTRSMGLRPEHRDAGKGKNPLKA